MNALLPLSILDVCGVGMGSLTPMGIPSYAISSAVSSATASMTAVTIAIYATISYVVFVAVSCMNALSLVAILSAPMVAYLT